MFVLMNGEYVETMEQTIGVPEIEMSYEEKVVSLIRAKYSIDEELAIQRQRDTKPEEFQAYFDYCEECKKEAR